MGIQQVIAGQSSVTNPNQLPSINLWYNASAGSTAQFGSTLADGAVITSWVDLTGSGHDANKAGSATIKPSWQSGEINGLGVVQFTSTESDSLDINPIAWAQSLPGSTIYVIAKANTLGNVSSTIVSSDQNDYNISWNGQYWQTRFAGGTGQATALVSDVTDYHVFGIIFDGSQTGNANRLKFRYDGVNQTLNFGATTVGTATSASGGYLYLGRDSGGTTYFNGCVATIMIFTRALNLSECIQVEQYLKNTWRVPKDKFSSNSLVYYIDASGYRAGNLLVPYAGATYGNTTIFNAPTFTNNPILNETSYLTTNGSNQYFYTPNLVSAFNSPSNTSVTLEVWVRADTDNGVILAEQGSTTIDASWFDSQMEIVSGTLRMSVWPLTSASAGTFSRSQWNHCVLTYDGTTLRTYLNAVAGGTTTGTRQVSWITANPGNQNYYYTIMAGTGTNLGDGSYLAANFGSFRIYNRALSNTEVTNNYNATKARYGL